MRDAPPIPLAPVETPNPAGILESTITVAAAVEDVLKIQTGRRESGPWAWCAMAVSNGNVLAETWTGTYGTSAEAAIAAGHAVNEWLPLPAELKKKAQRDSLNAIHVEIEKMDAWARSVLSAK